MSQGPSYRGRGSNSRGFSNRGNAVRGGNNRGFQHGYSNRGRGPAMNTPDHKELFIDFSNLNLRDKKSRAVRANRQEEMIRCNGYQLKVKPNQLVYRYDVSFVIEVNSPETGGIPFELGSDHVDNCSRQELSNIRGHLLFEFVKKHQLCDSHKMFGFDGVKTLLTYKNIDKQLTLIREPLIPIEQLSTQVTESIGIRNLRLIRILIQPCDGNVINLDDYKTTQKNSNLSCMNHDHAQIFDILTSTFVMSSGEYLNFGSGTLFPKTQDIPTDNNMQVTFLGLVKSVRFIEGTNCDDVFPMLLLDAKNGPFYRQCSLLEHINFFMEKKFRSTFRSNIPQFQLRKLEDYVKGLRLFSLKNPSVTFVCNGFTKEKIKELNTNRRDSEKPVPILSFYEGEHINPDFPAILAKRNKNMHSVWAGKYHAIEMLQVVPFQRVRVADSLNLPPRADRIQERFEKTEALKARLSLNKNIVLDSFGITVEEAQVHTQCFHRENPKLIYGNNIVCQTDNQGSWSSKNGRDKLLYASPSSSFNIIFLYCNARDDCVRSFAQIMETELRNRGVTNLGPSELKRIQFNGMENVFLAYSKLKKKCLIFFISDREEGHAELKYFERKYTIPTQQVCSKTILNVQNQTLSNICSKTNLKTGGLNFSVQPDSLIKNDWISNGKTLVISYDVSHTGRALSNEEMSAPSTVGFSYNAARNPECFIGDFHYQTPTQEKIAEEILNIRIRHILQLFVDNRKQLPDNIIIIRDGVSEGQYKMAVQEEFGEIQKACQIFKSKREVKWEPKFQLIVVTKRHHYRFHRYVDTKPGSITTVYNVNESTVIDAQVVRPNYDEFFMQGHHIIQGSGKIPLYTVLIDQLNWSLDKIQSFMLSLCFNHQIVEKPVSLPEPLYQADEWAKRGAQLFTVHRERTKSRFLISETEALTNELSYKGTNIQGIRVNA